MDNRKAFNFYRSYWDQMKLLKDKQRIELFDAICKVQFLEINIVDVNFKDPILNLVWAGIKHSIETSLKGYISKQKGLNKEIEIPLPVPLNKGLTKGGAQQEKEKEEEEVQEQEKYINKDIPTENEFLDYVKTIEIYKTELDYSIKSKYESWVENGWKDGNDKPIKNWKTKIKNTLPHLKPVYTNNMKTGVTTFKGEYEKW